MTDQQADVAVLGGGLAGLAAAATAAREGRSVIVLDARSELGGRARSEIHDGFTFNQGAHALYIAGAGRSVLTSLGVSAHGSMPRTRGSRLARDGRTSPLVSARSVPLGAWPSIARFLMGPGAMQGAEGLSAAEWIDSCPKSSAREGLAAAVHVSTYMADLEHADASATLAQLRRAARGVLYLDGGWQQLVDGLERVATDAGVQIVRGAKVTNVEASSAPVEVAYDGGNVVAGTIVIATGGPAHAALLLGDASPTVQRWADRARPVVATALDVALRRLPSKRRGVVLGLDQPTYLNLHTPAARLAPEGSGELMCLLRYSSDAEPDGDHRATLEALADATYPGWRDEVVHVRYGRHLVVAHDRPQPGVDPADRPAVAIPELPNVFVAGDWITTDGLLADASLSSAATAGRLAAARAVTPSSPAPARS